VAVLPGRRYGNRTKPVAAVIDETKAIELWPCGYNARCSVKNCRATATTIARSVDIHGRPIRQYDLCQVHCEQVTERERAKGREIVKRAVK
jgi:hypothetical protein